MTRRLLTAAVGLPVLWAAIWGGLPWLTILVGIAACLGVIELYRMLVTPRENLSTTGNVGGYVRGEPVEPPFDKLRANGVGWAQRLHRWPMMAFGLGWALLMVVLGHFADSRVDDLSRHWVHMALGAGLLLLFPWLIAKRREPLALIAVLGAGYIGFLLAHPLMLRGLDSSAAYALDWTYLAVAVVFATDTGAFATGKLLGRHQMAPSISPRKTWEGAVGGLVWGIAAGIVLHILLDLEVALWQTVVVAAAAGVAAQVGDLVESKVKRVSGVEDASGLLPGHGGILDRLDSIVLAIPVVYYLVAFVLKPSTVG